MASISNTLPTKVSSPYPGYPSVSEYVRDIEDFKRNGRWRLPLGMGDRLHFFFLTWFTRFSWFRDSLTIRYPSDVRPSWSIILLYLKRAGVYDTFIERAVPLPGCSLFYFEKTLDEKTKQPFMNGQGVAFDRDTALSKAIGEMVERIIGGSRDENTRITRGSARELQKHTPLLYPPDHHRFLDAQKRRHDDLSSSRDDVFSWVEGVNLITNETTLIPLHMTSWLKRFPEEKKLMNPSTSGEAGYFTPEGATLRGLLETVQRDGFLTHWLTNIAPDRIDPHTLPTPIQERLAFYESLGITLTLLDLTSLSIPTIGVVTESRHGEVPGVTVAAASALSYGEAVDDATREAAATIEFHLRSHRFPPPPQEHEPFVSRLNKTERMLFWRGADRLKTFSWFISGKEKPLPPNPFREVFSDKEQLTVCLETLKKRGPAYYPVVYTPKNRLLKKLGYHLSQVFIPKAFPLFLVEKYGTFESDRLREFVLEKGLSNLDLNPLPHPFT